MPQFNDWGERANSLAVVNATYETIPSGAIVAVSGAPDAKGRPVVGKPTANGQPGCLIVTGQSILPANSTDGEPTGWATFDTPAPAAFDPADGTPVLGEEWGPGEGSWLLRKGKPGFRIDGPPDADGPRVIVVRVGAADGDLIVRITGSVRVAAGSGGSDCEGSAFEADASGNWPSGVGSMGSGVGHNAYTGYLQRRECLLDPWEDYGDEVYVDDMNGRKLVVGDRYQVVRQGSVGGVASYTTRDDPTSPVTSGDSGDSGDSGSGSGDDCEEIHVLDCPASGSGDSGSGSGDGCVFIGDITISNDGGTCTGSFTLSIPTRIVRVPRCSTGGSA